jgi:hypothetical protein
LTLPGVGLVTGKVVTDSNEIVHGGMVLPPSGVPAVPYLRYPETTAGYMASLRVLRDVSVPWPWCFAARRQTLLAAGGCDPALLGPYAALDLGMRVRYRCRERIAYVPDARFVLGASQAPTAKPGPPRTAPPELLEIGEDLRRFRASWKHQLAAGDPYLNPGLDAEAIDLALAEPA